MRSRAALVCLTCVLSAPASGAVVLHDADIVVDATLTRSAESTAYVSVRGATGLRESEPIAGARVEVALESARGPTRFLGRAATGVDGVAIVRFRVPDVDPGSYVLAVRTASPHGDDVVRRPVEVGDRTHLHLRTDRGVYRPGQSIRWRVTALSGADAHPAAGEVALAIRDPRGTLVWRGSERVDAGGMVAGELPLGEDLILGTYALEASLGAAKARETVDVRSFVLAPFAVTIEPRSALPLAPGASFEAVVVARFAYGEPVAGSVAIEVKTADGDSVREENGTLDAHGRYAFTVAPDEDGLEVTATVTDGAKRAQTASLRVPLRSDRLAIAIVPERAALAAGAEQWVTVITTDGQGNLAPARVFFKPPRGQRVDQRSQGAVRFPFRAAAGRVELTAGAVDDAGRVATTTFRAHVGRDGSDRLIRARAAVVDSGQAVDVTGVWPAAHGPVVVTLLRRGAPVATAIARVDGAGNLAASLTPPEGVFGLLTVRAVDVGWDAKTGQVRADSQQASVYVRPTPLAVALGGARRHRPGSDATVDVAVTDARGAPAAGVALAASAVDERVLALSPARPDLVDVLTGLDVSKAHATGLVFADLLRRPGAAEKIALRAVLEALPPDPAEPAIRIAAAERFVAELERMRGADDAIYAYLFRDPRPSGVSTDGRWEFRASPADLLAEARWPEPRRLDPWKRATTWAYARQLVPDWTFDRTAGAMAGDRLDRLVERLQRIRRVARAALHRDPAGGLARLVASAQVGAYLAVDPWGTPIAVRRRADDGTRVIELASAGPDLTFATVDDLTRYDVFDEAEPTGLNVVVGYGHGYGGGAGMGSVGAGRYGTVGHGASTPEPVEVAVRRRFDETVLWVAGVRTDAAGKASLSVPLADSITGWEVAVEAVGPRGAVGATKTRLETFLPLYVDADVPPELTVDDRYVLAAVAANHGDRARTLTVAVTASGSVERAGAPSARVELPPGATRALPFALRAASVGDGRVKLTLADEDGKPVDAVERTIVVSPPGELVRELRTASVDRGRASLALSIPATAVAGTTGGRLRVFRGAGDQALDGLEGMLSEPHGCFEQTSSSTYPNLLVLRLLADQPGMAGAVARARTLVGKGYQRLVSYEVKGGGFSWFGEAPANQVLTAYGLLEFVDMAKVYPVDPALIERTRKWLLAQQRPDGSWRPDASWLHDWSAVQGKLSTTAYVAWALAESGFRGERLSRALAFLRASQLGLAGDGYLLGLWAAAETAAGTHDTTALRLLRRHARRADDALSFSAGARTLFYTRGMGADVQVTALAVTALARDGAAADAARALAWLWSARSPGYGWGTTQGTVLALRAAALAAPQAPARGALSVSVDGKPVGKIDLASAGVPSLDLPPLGPGTHTVRVDGEPTAALVADVRWWWRDGGAPQPVRRGIDVTLRGPEAAPGVGDTAALELKLSNPGTEAVAMPTVVVPVPPGFAADADSLAALVRDKRIAKFSDQGAELHFYLTELAPRATTKLAYRLRANAEVDVTQRPARAHAYYDPAVAGSSAGLRLRAR